MTEDQRGIRRKKRVIEYAEKNGNIKTACRRFGIARSTFYLWRDRYYESGDEGLKSRRFGCHHNHRNKTPATGPRRGLTITSIRGHRARTQLSSSPGQSPTPGPLQIRTRRLPPSGSSADAARGYEPQIRTVIRGRGSGKSRSRSPNRSHVRRLRWLRRQSHLYQIRFACSITSSKLLKFPLTPK